MSAYFLLDHERDTLIIPCRQCLSGLSTSQCETLAHEVLRAFGNWKSRLVDKNGLVKVVSGGAGLLFPEPTEALVPHDSVEAWQCAGPFVKNDIDLAFHLWVNEDPDFAALLERYSPDELLSIVGIWSWRTAEPASLIRLNGLLVGILIDDMSLERESAGRLRKKVIADVQRGRANLARAREIRKTKSTTHQTHQALRTAAFDYLSKRPLAKNDELIRFLQEHGFGDFKESTIERLIAGVRLEVKEYLQSADTPRTDLYSTGQKRNR